MVRQPPRVGRDRVIELRWAPLARRDLDSIDRFHRQDHIGVADELVGRVIDAARALTEMPMAGPVSKRSNRKWRVAGTPDILFYRAAADHIRILSVRHGARDNSRW